MTPAGEILAAEIREKGPIPFSRFMEVALYDRQFGYYRRARRDPFGKDGDFFTASQLQPVFGRVVAAALRELRETLGSPEDFQVIELGAGRGEMEPGLAEFHYASVDIDRGELPSGITGVIFANEFFDALPVNVPGRSVDFRDGRFVWAGDGEWKEDAVGMRAELPRIAACLKNGYLLAIDYGFTSAERIRFPAGSLMSYRRHRPVEDVLRDPGEQDITAHVPFTEMFEVAEQYGLTRMRFETLAQFLLRVGERDEFKSVLAAGSEGEDRKLTNAVEDPAVRDGRDVSLCAAASAHQIKTAPISRGRCWLTQLSRALYGRRVTTSSSWQGPFLRPSSLPSLSRSSLNCSP